MPVCEWLDRNQMRIFKPLIKKVRRSLGLIYELDHTNLSVKLRDKDEAGGNATYLGHNRVRVFAAGWYMLEIDGARDALGHDLAISTSDSEQVHLQIGGKPVTKRIVRIAEPASEIKITITPEITDPALVKLRLARVTETFAVDRMRRKLSTSNGVAGNRYASRSKAHAHRPEIVYHDYTRLIQRHVQRPSYDEWLSHRESSGSEKDTHVFGRLPGESKIGIMFCGDQVSLDALLSQPVLRDGDTPLLLPVVTQTASVGKRLDSVNSLHWLGSDSSAWQRLLDDCDYVVIIGDGVLISNSALPRVSAVLTQAPDLQLLYSDHDVMTEQGKRRSPAFKPSWNPELLLAGNYIGNFVVASSSLVKRAGGLDHAQGDSIVYDFLLRTIPVVDELKVERIARMLFSRPFDCKQQRSAMSVGFRDQQVLERHLSATGANAVVRAGLIDDVHRVQWLVPSPPVSVDIIIPTRDRVDLLSCCVDSILNQTDYPNYKITIVDNGSTESDTHQYYTRLHDDKRVNVIDYPGEFNYSAINNYAVAQTNGSVVLLLNNDTEVIDDDWLQHLVAQAVRKEIGCVGAKLYYSSGLIQHAGVIVGIRGVAGHGHRFYPRDADGHCGRLKIAHNVTAVTGACLALRREVFEEIGGLDDINLKVAYNDVDLCLRAREAGYKNVWTPHVQLFHHESVSRGSDDTRQKARRFQSEYNYMKKRWQTDKLQDPSYNPNLALDQEDFWLAA